VRLINIGEGKAVISFSATKQFTNVVLQPANRTPPNITRSKPQHTTKREKDNRYGNPSTQSQAPEDGHTNVRNMLSKY
jgi:hypothetical protein